MMFPAEGRYILALIQVVFQDTRSFTGTIHAHYQFGVSKITFIQQGHIQLIKSDIKTVFFSIHQIIMKNIS